MKKNTYISIKRNNNKYIKNSKKKKIVNNKHNSYKKKKMYTLRPFYGGMNKTQPLHTKLYSYLNHSVPFFQTKIQPLLVLISNNEDGNVDEKFICNLLHNLKIILSNLSDSSSNLEKAIVFSLFLEVVNRSSKQLEEIRLGLLNTPSKGHTIVLNKDYFKWMDLTPVSQHPLNPDVKFINTDSLILDEVNEFFDKVNKFFKEMDTNKNEYNLLFEYIIFYTNKLLLYFNIIDDSDKQHIQINMNEYFYTNFNFYTSFSIIDILITAFHYYLNKGSTTESEISIKNRLKNKINDGLNLLNSTHTTAAAVQSGGVTRVTRADKRTAEEQAATKAAKKASTQEATKEEAANKARGVATKAAKKAEEANKALQLAEIEAKKASVEAAEKARAAQAAQAAPQQAKTAYNAAQEAAKDAKKAAGEAEKQAVLAAVLAAERFTSTRTFPETSAAETLQVATAVIAAGAADHTAKVAAQEAASAAAAAEQAVAAALQPPLSSDQVREMKVDASNSRLEANDAAVSAAAAPQQSKAAAAELAAAAPPQPSGTNFSVSTNETENNLFFLLSSIKKKIRDGSQDPVMTKTVCDEIDTYAIDRCL
jgi:hypothetical protein